MRSARRLTMASRGFCGIQRGGTPAKLAVQMLRLTFVAARSRRCWTTIAWRLRPVAWMTRRALLFSLRRKLQQRQTQ